jgi:hypothetical protein
MINPAMDIDLYLDRYKTVNNISEKLKCLYGMYVLEPTINSSVAKNHK